MTIIFTKDQLKKLYIEENKSIKQIAEDFILSTSVVWNHLKLFDIKTKPRHKTYKVWTTKPEWKELKHKCNKEHSKRMKGCTPWNKGLDKSDPRVIKYVKGLKKAHKDGKFSYSWAIGRKLSKEHRSKLSLGHGGTGIPYENSDYSEEFNDSLKESIRKRDEYRCQICGLKQEKNYRKLDVHHIDYNKKNCKENNLTSLCYNCHKKTNYNRKHWINYFKKEEVLI